MRTVEMQRKKKRISVNAEYDFPIKNQAVKYWANAIISRFQTRVSLRIDSKKTLARIDDILCVHGKGNKDVVRNGIIFPTGLNISGGLFTNGMVNF